MNFIPYSRQSIDDDDIQAVVEVLKSDCITQGPKVREFEDALASYCKAKYAVVLSSGTAALHAAYFSAGIGKGDEIITSPITFVATANAALFLGARPVFVDVEPDTGNINHELIQQAITSKTKAIVPVHFAGHPADLDPIHQIAGKNDLIVIEDACHALGASYKGKRIGSLSDMTVFSFHPVKSITTGEGGAVLTNSEEYYEKLVMFRTHGITKDSDKFENEPHGDWYYEMQKLGYNYRMTDIQAALGISQLGKLDLFINRRTEIFARYDDAFNNNDWFEIPIQREYASSAWHLYTIRLKNDFTDKKAQFVNNLRAKGISTQVHYRPVYLHPYYRDLGFSEGLCPKAETFYEIVVSLPIFQGMKDIYVNQVIKEVKQCLRQ